jgi:glutathione synthase/RimK-type ligase-like ATP-grasp enzyme
MNITTFDLLVVYSSELAKSAASRSPAVTSPFYHSIEPSYDEVYSYFLQACHRNHLRAAFAISADVVGAGLCKSYWLFEKGTWKKVKRAAYAELIFDKFAPVTKELSHQFELLFSSTAVRPFNEHALRRLFFDKQRTFEKFRSLTIPTVAIHGHSANSVTNAVKTLRRIMSRKNLNADFSTDLILKDRFGVCGQRIYKFGSSQMREISATLKKNATRSFVLQPFLLFDHGYRLNNQTETADIRLIYLNGRMIQTYVRMAKKGSFLCNVHQGGFLKYITRRDVPPQVFRHAAKVLRSLGNMHTLYALDFVVTNAGHPLLLEGNTSPGLDWNPDIQIDIDSSKKLIRMVVVELARLVQVSRLTRKNLAVGVETRLVFSSL